MSTKEFSYLHTPTDYCYSYLTVPERMQQLAAYNSDKDVYVFLYPDGRRDSISAGTLFKMSKAFAKSLIQLGLKKGDVVATCLPNDKDALISTFGIIFAGCIISHMLLRDKDGTDVKRSMRKIGAKCLVLHPGVNEEQFRACMNFIDEIDQGGNARSSNVPSLQLVITTSQVKEKKLLQFDDLLTWAVNDDVILPRLDPEEKILLFTTSGTTGDCKFAPHTHHDVMIMGHQIKESIGYNAQDVLFSERRIAWIGGFPFMYLHDCAKVVTLTHHIANFSEHTKFTYNALLSEKCTIACVFPATVAGILDMYPSMPDGQLLKNIHIGGVTLASSVMNAIGVITERVTNCYAMSESGVFTSNHVNEKYTYLEFSTGKPVAGAEIKVVDKDNFIVERGQTGMICARLPSTAKSYYIDGNTTLPVQSTGGWVDTGDVGFVTEDGQLVVAGRVSDTLGVLYTGGRYMRGLITYVEALIKEHPSVLEVVAVTVPDDVFVEKVYACVIPLPGKKLTTGQLENFCKSKIVPGAEVREDFGRIMLFQSFPKLCSGKPDKRSLREEIMRQRKEDLKK